MNPDLTVEDVIKQSLLTLTNVRLDQIGIKFYGLFGRVYGNDILPFLYKMYYSNSLKEISLVAERIVLHYLLFCTSGIRYRDESVWYHQYSEEITAHHAIFLKCYHAEYRVKDENFIPITKLEQQFIGRLLGYAKGMRDFVLMDETPRQLASVENDDTFNTYMANLLKRKDIDAMVAELCSDVFEASEGVDQSCAKLINEALQNEADGGCAGPEYAMYCIPPPTPKSLNSIKDIKELLTTLFYGNFNSLKHDDLDYLKNVFEQNEDFNIITTFHLDFVRFRELVMAYPSLMGTALSFMLAGKDTRVYYILNALILNTFSNRLMVAIVQMTVDTLKRGVQLKVDFIDSIITASLRFLEADSIHANHLKTSDNARFVRLIINYVDVVVCYMPSSIEHRFGEILSTLARFNHIRTASVTYNRVIQYQQDRQNLVL